MYELKEILVPTDFSEESNIALKFAADVARKIPGHTLFLLHIIEHPHGDSFHVSGEMNLGGGMDSLFLLKLIERSKERIHEQATQDFLEGVNVETTMFVGRPYQGISEVMEQKEVDLTVMTTHEISGLNELFIGTETQRVVRGSHCPVIALKEEIEVKEIKKIALATDLNLDQFHLVEAIRDFQNIFNAHLDIVWINTRNSFLNERMAKERLKTYVEKGGFTNCDTHVYSHESEEDGIIYFAEDHDSDMIAMGTHGRSGILQIITGSVAEDVVKHAKRPVWTMKI
jgi:nucleotide-binding universal stress UspA family protein